MLEFRKDVFSIGGAYPLETMLSFEPGVKVFLKITISEDDTVRFASRVLLRIGVIVGIGLAGCWMYDGVSIGKNSVVAAGSIVTKSVKAELGLWQINARVIRRLS